MGSTSYAMTSKRIPAGRFQPNFINSAFTEYPCFYLNIRLYEMGHLFSVEDKPDGSRLSRIIPKISWGFVFFMSFSLSTNLALLLGKYFASDKKVFGTEIFHRSFEVLLGPLFILEMLLFTHKLHPMIKEMRQTFDTSEKEILEQCIRSERRMFITSLFSAILVMFMGYFQKIFLGLSDEEIASAKYYYDKAHPEKQLPMVFWLPFDDTVAPTYYIMAILNIYALVLTAVLATGLISNISTFSIHIRGQYQMMARQLLRATSGSELKVIIQKHQNLVKFRGRMAGSLANTCLMKAFVYNLTITCCLYQISSVFAEKELNQRAIQLIFEWIVLLIMFYAFTISSEVIDEGNDILYSAIRSFKWYNVENFKRDGSKPFQLFTRMCRKPMRLIYYGGTVDVCYRSFLAVMKLSYSLFTLLKQSIHTE